MRHFYRSIRTHLREAINYVTGASQWRKKVFYEYKVFARTVGDWKVMMQYCSETRSWVNGWTSSNVMVLIGQFFVTLHVVALYQAFNSFFDVRRLQKPISWKYIEQISLTFYRDKIDLSTNFFLGLVTVLESAANLQSRKCASRVLRGAQRNCCLHSSSQFGFKPLRIHI